MDANLETLLRKTAEHIESQTDLSRITSGENFEK